MGKIQIDEGKINDAKTSLGDLIERIDAINVESSKVAGDSGLVADRMVEADANIESFKTELKGLINDTIDTLEIIKNNAIELNASGVEKAEEN